MIRKYKPSTQELENQYAKEAIKYEVFVPNFDEEIILYTAKLWHDWLEHNKEPPDSYLDREIIAGSSLRYWINKYRSVINYKEK